MSMERVFVNCRSARVATSTIQMSASPVREEKNAIVLPSGDQAGWKSPPAPFVSCRVVPSRSESSQRFMSPERSELKAIVSPSGDQDPRLSSRVVETTS